MREPSSPTRRIIGWKLMGLYNTRVTFHREDCWHIEGHKARRETRPLSRKMAVDCGFHACEDCRP